MIIKFKSGAEIHLPDKKQKEIFKGANTKMFSYKK